jgi:TrpR-related protein YerC/YecD
VLLCVKILMYKNLMLYCRNKEVTVLNSKLKNDSTDYLFKAILSLENEEDCYRFFEDLCTSAELKAMSQRLVVAKMLTEKKVYTEIVKETGASTATISRVKRALFDNDTYGYTLVLDRIENGEKE